MLELEQIRERLKDRNLSFISQEVNMSYATVWKIAKRKDKAVSYSAIKRLSDYFEAQERA